MQNYAFGRGTGAVKTQKLSTGQFSLGNVPRLGRLSSSSFAPLALFKRRNPRSNRNNRKTQSTNTSAATMIMTTMNRVDESDDSDTSSDDVNVPSAPDEAGVVSFGMGSLG